MAMASAFQVKPHQVLGLTGVDILAEDRMGSLCSEEAVSMVAGRTAENLLPDRDLEDPGDACPDIDDRKSG